MRWMLAPLLALLLLAPGCARAEIEGLQRQAAERGRVLEQKKNLLRDLPRLVKEREELEKRREHLLGERTRLRRKLHLPEAPDGP